MVEIRDYRLDVREEGKEPRQVWRVASEEWEERNRRTIKMAGVEEMRAETCEVRRCARMQS